MIIPVNKVVFWIGFVQRILINNHDPIEEFIESLESKDAAKVLDRLEFLDKQGISLGPPYVKELKKYDLWEFRVQYRRNQYRILFFVHNGIIILLHGFQYKDQISQREIGIALARKEDLLNNLDWRNNLKASVGKIALLIDWIA